MLPKNIPPPKRRRTIKLISSKFIQIFSRVWRFITKNSSKIFKNRSASWQKVRGWDKVFAVGLLIFWLGLILGNFVFKGLYVFEGNLLVTEMNFTYGGYVDKTFLKTFDAIESLDIQGKQKEPLTLTGKFTSDDDTLNQNLSKIKQLEIEFSYTTSRVIFAPTQPSELTLDTLIIPPNTQVNQLNYQDKYNQLSFCLQAAELQLNSCYINEYETSNQDLFSVGKLDLKLGQQLITVSLAMVNIPQLGIKAHLNNPQEITFQFTPNVDQSLLTLLSPSQIYLKLPDPNSSNSSQIENNLDVKNVQFSQYENPQTVTEKFKQSTVLKGEVRLGDEIIKLQQNQFLTILSKPGIKKIYSIKIKTESPQGLDVLFTGESTGIATGLYEELPVQTLEPSWLSQYLSEEAIAAIIGFISAFTGILIPRLFPEPSQKP
ncbi:hypothetical protein PCC7424_2944 [Gloeothece citriformis PCC 7424]|uniref:Uncharacterized protein n=1 Tax=Gloeothece citriformis (strain PCC 7424) TaxID=65393 RepID=B7K9Z2_GLOC7|nr:hypothetical protein [Gloeothece citriformis]ACK71348.1 hypothetical protein PCC7424_2944 [Gloeothece citriformis PCC 7424]